MILIKSLKNKNNMNYHLIAKKFWNSKNTTKEFYAQPFSGYWLDFFGSIKDASKKKVLDIGCGGGRNTEMLINFGFDVFACDFYQGMVRTTKNRLIKKGFKSKFVEDRIKKAPMTKLPYDSSNFDIVLCHGVYHNAQSLEEFDHALEESARVLKKGGHLYFNMFTSDLIAEDFKNVDGQPNVYITREKLPMVLLSKGEFVKLASRYSLKPDVEFIEYESNVSTGKRSVLRGILIKKSDK